MTDSQATKPFEIDILMAQVTQENIGWIVAISARLGDYDEISESWALSSGRAIGVETAVERAMAGLYEIYHRLGLAINYDHLSCIIEINHNKSLDIDEEALKQNITGQIVECLEQWPKAFENFMKNGPKMVEVVDGMD